MGEDCSEELSGALEDSMVPAMAMAGPARKIPMLAPTHLKASGLGDLPREKMEKLGPDSLSDVELLALLFGTGTQGLNVLEMSRLLLRQYGSLTGLSRVPLTELKRQKGIGPAKAIHLAAALTLGKRLAHERFGNVPLETPEQLVELLGPEMRQLSQESLRVVLVTTKYALISIHEIHLGSVAEVQANIRDILRPVIVQSAGAFIITHNHPSGDPSPSNADKDFTTKLKDAARLMRLPFLDHIIIGQPGESRPLGYYSFREHGMM